MIKGGYYIKARCIQESEISIAPPYVREIWDWLLKECNHKDKISSGRIIHRGECVRSFKDIQEGLKWKVGYRVEKYKKWHCEKAMKWLKRATMIETTKTTRGMFIKVLKYDIYQNPKNYESNNESYNEATREQQSGDTINKNDKKDKKDCAKAQEIFSSKNYIKSLISNKRKDLHIIGLFLSYKEINFDNKEQASSQIKRHLKPAGLLKGYSDEQIKATFDEIDKESDYDKKYVWTLETIHKRLGNK